jgi:predicted nuclease with TOPRIM domain
MLEFYIVTTIMALASYTLRVHYGNKMTEIKFRYLFTAEKELKRIIKENQERINELEEEKQKGERIKQEAQMLINKFNEQIEEAKEVIEEYQELRHSIYLKTVLCFIPLYNIFQGLLDALVMTDFYNQYKNNQGDVQDEKY